ncbi:helix-turn-helix domain-containing protein [Nonomuraea sp. NPDC051941]|uniref:helix-turn-helix domain-containing protein n=1 Tax=Nonomuraea sp. NPDC051941 TaxID=3364373 RepID=UPI0037C6D67F
MAACVPRFESREYGSSACTVCGVSVTMLYREGSKLAAERDSSPGSGAQLRRSIARNVRNERQKHGWTLDELAARSGVSRGMIIQIEHGDTNPSVGTLCRLADALLVDVVRLVEHRREPHGVRITRLADLPALRLGESTSVGRLLTLINYSTRVELWDWTLEPGDSYATNAVQKCIQLVYVVLGDIVVAAAGAKYVICEGESIEFRAAGTYSYENVSQLRARFLGVIVVLD